MVRFFKVIPEPVDINISVDSIGLAKETTLQKIAYKYSSTSILSTPYPNVSVAAGSSTVLLDTSALPNPIKIIQINLGAQGNLSLCRFYVYVYNEDGTTTLVSVHIDSNLIKQGFISGDTLNYTTYKHNGLFELVEYDTTNNQYVIALRQPISGYGVRIVAENADTVSHTFAASVIYENMI